MRYFFLLLLLGAVLFAFAQQPLTVKLAATDTTQDFFSKKFQLKSPPKDSIELQTALAKVLQKIKSAGFIAASLDTVTCKNRNCEAVFFIGQKISVFRISKGNVEQSFLRESGFTSQKTFQKLSVQEIEKLESKLLTNAENRGYPFAEVYLDSFSANPPSATIAIDKHELFVFDTIQLMEKVRVKRKFISSYLGIKRGKPYDESKIKAIEQRINALQFVEQNQKQTILFDKEKAITQLYLRNKKSSVFNFFLGVLPGGAGQKVLITGEAKLHLYSVLGFGEQFNIEWNKTLPKTQVLKAMIAFPYLFGLPLGVDVRFELFKRDTSWLDIDRDFGIRYQFAGMNYVKASLKQKTTIVLNTDTSFVIANRRLPNSIDVNTNEFAVEYNYLNLDYRFNPTKGWNINVGGAAGEKRIKRNSTINDLKDEKTGETFSYLYDSIGTRNYQLQFFVSIEKFWRITKRMTVLTGLKGKYFYSPTIFENEKYRLGGLATLRGFTEESIITPYFGMLNVEYRYLFSKNAYVYAFFNTAVVENVLDVKRVDLPFGFGAGASLETKAGIFAVTYALGQKADAKLSFRDSKIHFGYVNYF